MAAVFFKLSGKYYIYTLGDSPAVGVAIDENCGKYEYREAPVLNEDTSYTFKEGRRKIRVYNSIDSRFVLEDFMSKIELMYGAFVKQ